MNKLYLKLAWSNLKNSRQFYLPYVIAGMLSAMMFYTMCAIQGNEGLSKMRGGTSVQMVLFFGAVSYTHLKSRIDCAYPFNTLNGSEKFLGSK